MAALWLPGTRTIGAWALIGLLAVFAAALTTMLARGRREMSCACFGRASRPVSWLLPVRNAGLGAVLAAFLATQSAAVRWPSPEASVIIVLLALLGWLLMEYRRAMSIVSEA